MRVCVVGQGPSAEGMGREIDACDVVVRIKNFWEWGAQDSGEKCDVWAQYGGIDLPSGVAASEHWFTICPHQLESHGKAADLISSFNRNAAGHSIRWLDDERWMQARAYLLSHPTTGFVCVLMALQTWPDAELHVHGFDSMQPDGPNYYDARAPVDHKGVVWPHDMAGEKRAIAEIYGGRFLGNPTSATLVWPHPPAGIREKQS